jgi:hypothetical protein
MAREDEDDRGGAPPPLGPDEERRARGARTAEGAGRTAEAEPAEGEGRGPLGAEEPRRPHVTRPPTADREPETPTGEWPRDRPGEGSP